MPVTETDDTPDVLIVMDRGRGEFYVRLRIENGVSHVGLTGVSLPEAVNEADALGHVADHWYEIGTGRISDIPASVVRHARQQAPGL